MQWLLVWCWVEDARAARAAGVADAEFRPGGRAGALVGGGLLVGAGVLVVDGALVVAVEAERVQMLDYAFAAEDVPAARLHGRVRKGHVGRNVVLFAADSAFSAFAA